MDVATDRPAASSPIGQFVEGFAAPFEGLSHMRRNPSLWRYGIVPILLNVLITALTLAALLVGRHFYGWRGRTALRWTLVGFVLLLLAYVGSRFVLEVVLGRGAA